MWDWNLPAFAGKGLGLFPSLFAPQLSFQLSTLSSLNPVYCNIFHNQPQLQAVVRANWSNATLIQILKHDSGPVHTETFSCVFELFTVLKGIENNQLITWNNTKTQENVSVCTWPQTRKAYRDDVIAISRSRVSTLKKQKN